MHLSLDELRRCLRPVDLRTREARAAQGFMTHKGYPEVRPLGMAQVEGDTCWYFYYLLPQCLIELEVSLNDGIDYERRLTAYRDLPPEAQLQAC